MCWKKNFFRTSVPTVYLYTLDTDLFGKLWHVHMVYSTAVDMNGFITYNAIDEFQHHSIGVGGGEQVTVRYIE